MYDIVGILTMGRRDSMVSVFPMGPLASGRGLYDIHSLWTIEYS